ncbi:uncharacterized protein BDV17DRAFT_251356 [Aspergillus undulatus]|uniref:uncharacterized protein n=1 Tax=Aspergillus undulatus TaxID=1810928 RepID=UPI003CCDBFF9
MFFSMVGRAPRNQRGSAFSASHMTMSGRRCSEFATASHHHPSTNHQSPLANIRHPGTESPEFPSLIRNRWSNVGISSPLPYSTASCHAATRHEYAYRRRTRPVWCALWRRRRLQNYSTVQPISRDSRSRPTAMAMRVVEEGLAMDSSLCGCATG